MVTSDIDLRPRHAAPASTIISSPSWPDSQRYPGASRPAESATKTSFWLHRVGHLLWGNSCSLLGSLGCRRVHQETSSRSFLNGLRLSQPSCGILEHPWREWPKCSPVLRKLTSPTRNITPRWHPPSESISFSLSLNAIGVPLAKLQNDLSEFVALLNSNGVEYLVVGGHAVALRIPPHSGTYSKNTRAGGPEHSGTEDRSGATNWWSGGRFLFGVNALPLAD
jgi:hypothetical protein